jgi:hypothetical protein
MLDDVVRRGAANSGVGYLVVRTQTRPAAYVAAWSVIPIVV